MATLGDTDLHPILTNSCNKVLFLGDAVFLTATHFAEQSKQATSMIQPEGNYPTRTRDPRSEAMGKSKLYTPDSRQRASSGFEMDVQNLIKHPNYRSIDQSRGYRENSQLLWPPTTIYC